MAVGFCDLIRGFVFNSTFLNFVRWDLVLFAEHFFYKLSERKLSAAKIQDVSTEL